MTISDHLEFRHLKYILAVAETGSFTAAALKMHVAQSAISRQIGEVEDIYKIQIFQRVERRGRHNFYRIARLTVAGESLLVFAHQLLESRHHVIEAVQALQQSAMRPFRLGFSPFVEHQVLQSVTQIYRDLFSKGEIEPEGGDTEILIDRLRGGEIDAALVTLPINSDGILLQPLMREKLVVCLRKDDPLARHDSLGPELLTGHIGIFSDPRHHPRAHARLLEMLKGQGIVPRISNPTFNSGHVQWMVKERVCLALTREHEILDEELTTRPIRNVNWTVDSALVYRAEPHEMALPLLLSELKRRFPVSGMERPFNAEICLGPTQESFPFAAGVRKPKK